MVSAKTVVQICKGDNGMSNTVRLIIEIPQEKYTEIKRGINHFSLMAYAIRKGTPLPKGHGRLIDADRFDVISFQHISDDFDNGIMWLAEQIDRAPTIIEADVRGEDNECND